MTDKIPQQMTAAQRSLVEANIDLAHHLALSAWRKNLYLQDKDDVVSAAYEGLIHAAVRFDPSRADVVDGVPDLAGAFSGYARRRINGAILDWQRQRDHVPRRQRSTYNTLLEQGHGGGRSPQELSDLTGMPEPQIRKIIQAVENMAVPLHINNPNGHDEDSEPWTSGQEDGQDSTAPDVEESVIVSRIRGAVVEAFDELPPFQRVIIAMRYYQGMEPSAIAETLGVRLTSVRAAHAEALLDLHAAMVHEAS